MKPMLKAPGTKRLKLRYEEQLSNLAFKFNLRRYSVVLWFDTAFSARFCADEAVVLSTSPFARATHWAQTMMHFPEPVALIPQSGAAATAAAAAGATAGAGAAAGGAVAADAGVGALGSAANPAASLKVRWCKLHPVLKAPGARNSNMMSCFHVLTYCFRFQRAALHEGARGDGEVCV